MEAVDGRTYKVGTDEFPLGVEIRAELLASNRAVVGKLRVLRGGTLIEEIAPELRKDEDAGTVHYQIGPPTSSPPCDIRQTIDGFFDGNAPDAARYQITITSAGGDTAQTAIRLPSVNPGRANLEFQVR